MAIHVVVTDSGVGGLSTCAAVERSLRLAGHAGARITYVNAWPSEEGGYNDMPDIRAEAEVFDRALNAMAALRPNLIVIACNTLSIAYEHTRYRRSVASPVPLPPSASPRPSSAFPLPPSASPLPPSAFPLPPVIGIVDAGVQLFHELLTANPDGQIALFGTKTTIESGVHRERLVARGVEPGRILPVGCHGLAKSIETEMDSPATMLLIEECAGRAAALASSDRGDRTLYLGVCCTHYTYLREEMRAALHRHAGGIVEVLDPTDRLVSQVVPDEATSEAVRRETTPGVVSPEVLVISKVRMPEEKRRVLARRLAAVSEATARALMIYTHAPALF
jgi:glutamate racemase